MATSAMNGSAIAKSDKPVAPIVSAVATTGLPSPPVMTPDFARSSAELPLVRPAIPPPPMIATGQTTLGGRSVITAALATAPATRVGGTREHVEQVIDTGDVVGKDLGDGSRAEHDERGRAGKPVEMLGQVEPAEACGQPRDEQRQEHAEAGGRREADAERDAGQRGPRNVHAWSSSLVDTPGGILAVGTCRRVRFKGAA